MSNFIVLLYDNYERIHFFWKNNFSISFRYFIHAVLIRGQGKKNTFNSQHSNFYPHLHRFNFPYFRLSYFQPLCNPFRFTVWESIFKYNSERSHSRSSVWKLLIVRNFVPNFIIHR